MIELIPRFERALAKRNPLLVQLLQPGLSEADVQKQLRTAGITGIHKPICSLYSWKNGTRTTRGRTLEELSLFPQSPFCFEELQQMLAHFVGFREFAENNPGFAAAVGRCFPLFWDSSSQWIAIDLKSAKGRVVLFDSEMAPPIQELYCSFAEFLEDAIRANEENHGLSCFHKR